MKTEDGGQKIQIKLKYLQSRASTLQLKLNEQLGRNKQMRAQIDNYRKERVVYDKIYRDLEYEYKQAKINFMRCIREQKGVLHQRDVTLEQLA